MQPDSPLKKVFVRTGLEGLIPSDGFGLRFSIHGEEPQTFMFASEKIEGRLLISDVEPKRIVVVATNEFNLAGSPDSLMQFCRMVDETVSSMMAYAYSPEEGKWL